VSDEDHIAYEKLRNLPSSAPVTRDLCVQSRTQSSNPLAGPGDGRHTWALLEEGTLITAEAEEERLRRRKPELTGIPEEAKAVER
jgi:hypothetical protein